LEHVFGPLRCAADDTDYCGEATLHDAAARTIATEAATFVYTKTATSRPDVASAALHVLAHVAGVSELERLAAALLAGPDSELRKNAIVLLVRHGSAIGQQRLDEAFRGASPRHEQFRQIDEYIYGSQAADAYRRLARHDLRQTGKTFPPAGSENDDASTVAAWDQFIKDYPWFPSTDDAYYRKAFAQLAIGDREGARRTVREYQARTFPDNDVGKCMKRLLEAIATADASGVRLPTRRECCLEEDAGECASESAEPDGQ
jgi:hypothetical protein